MTKTMQKGDQVTLYRLSQPIAVHTVIKRCKNLIVIDNQTRWNSDGSPQNDEQLDNHIKPWTESDQAFLNERVTVSSSSGVQRTMRVKTVFKETIVLDYGENSNFSIKFSLKDGRSLTEGLNWGDFRLPQEAIEQYLGRSNE